MSGLSGGLKRLSKRKLRKLPKCNYCGQEFGTKSWLQAHENGCEENPNRTVRKTK